MERFGKWEGYNTKKKKKKIHRETTLTLQNVKVYIATIFFLIFMFSNLTHFANFPRSHSTKVVGV